MNYTAVGRFDTRQQDPDTDPDDPSSQTFKDDDLQLGTPTCIYAAKVGFDSFKNRLWPAPLNTMKKLPCVAVHSQDDRYNDVVEFVVALCVTLKIKLEEADEFTIAKSVNALLKLAPNGNVATANISSLDSFEQRAFNEAYTPQYIQFCRDNPVGLTCTERYSLYCRARKLGVGLFELVKKAPYECAKVTILCRKEATPRAYRCDASIQQRIFEQDLFPYIHPCAMSLFGLQYSYIEQIRRHAVEAIRYHIQDGHTFVSIDRVWQSMVRKNGNLTREDFLLALEKPILKSLVPPDKFSLSANEDWDIVNMDGKLFPEPLYRAEYNVAKSLLQVLNTGRIDNNIIKSDCVDVDLDVPNDLDICVPLSGLSQEQIEALEMSCKNRVMILTGGPGTGKTTTLARLAANLAMNRYTVYTVAFTGKASNRAAAVQAEKTLPYVEDAVDVIQEDLGEKYTENVEWRIIKPSTIHKYVYSKHNTQNNALIIDEASMCSIMTIHKLLSATHGNLRIIIVGDHCQLPPVSHGVFLDDLIRSGEIPCTNLTRNFRAESVPGLINIQTIVRKSILNHQYLTDPIVCDTGFKIIPDNVDRLPIYISMYKRHSLEGDRVIPGSFLVVVNTRIESSELVNQAIRDVLNPPGMKREHAYFKNVWREGDRVMCTDNLYERKEVTGVDARTRAYYERNHMSLDETKKRNVSEMVCANGESGEIFFAGFAENLGDVNPDLIHWKSSAKKEVIGVRFDTGRECYMPLSVFNKKFILCYVITVHKAQGDEYDRVVYAMKPLSIMNRPRIVLTALSRAKQESIYMGDKMLLQSAINNIEADNRNTQLYSFLQSM